MDYKMASSVNRHGGGVTVLSKEDNELLTHVGPGTPMGALMRRYWLPFLYSWELAPDGPPLRVRLLGEDLLAFRATDGRVGLVGERCPHRGASLYYGRNEECGLRCVYHGWKYDADGNCVDMMNEAEDSSFKYKIHHKAYRAADWGGLVFAYMGPTHVDPPGLPEFEWATLPEQNVHHEYKCVQPCNWMQALEGDIDSAHLFILHSRIRKQDPPSYGVFHDDTSPDLHVTETDYGLLYGARRDQGRGQSYWRTTQFLMPVFALFPAERGFVPSHMWVPIDDEHTLAWGVRWHPTQEMPHRELLSRSDELAAVGPMLPEQKGKFYAHWWPASNPENEWMLDREVQQERTFTGIPTIRMQDSAMTTSMGSLMERSEEHLGSTDAMIIKTRQRLLQAARELQADGTAPPGSKQPELYRARSCSAVLPANADWRTALDDWHHCRTDEISSEQLLAASTRAG
jgi:phenylpropionate dioxygenase-like ring-hydroxylating dioxygenase large terminal subunit